MTFGQRWAISVMLLASCATALAQRGGPAADAQIVADATPVATGAHIALYQHGGIRVDAAFLGLAEDAYRRIEALIGRRLDTPTPGEKVRIYVSDAVSVSHVWGGYGHRNDPRAIIFLASRVYPPALRGTNATYIHELTHLFTWRFSSHTLREGLADYVALRLLPGAAVGPNPAGYPGIARVPQDILDHLGTSRPPPGAVTGNPDYRRAYYYASYRLVKHLVEKRDMQTFMRLYDSENHEAEIEKLYGEPREALVRAALTAP